MPQGLAYETDGAGLPVVFLHGLTFNRRTWRPVIERLGGSVQSIAIDLPAHGDSGGTPAPLDDIAAHIHELLEAMAVERPIMIGHSMFGGLACLYAATHPTRGVAVIDNGPDIRPFAQLARQVEPVLRGPGFADAWQTFERSLGLEQIPEPVRSLVLANHEVKQEVVLSYWDTMLRIDPSELQALIDAALSKIRVPCLGVFGRPITEAERERFERLPDVELEEWVGDGHFVHLVDADRFAARLRKFFEHCMSSACGADGPARPSSTRPNRQGVWDRAVR